MLLPKPTRMVHIRSRGVTRHSSHNCLIYRMDLARQGLIVGTKPRLSAGFSIAGCHSGRETSQNPLSPLSPHI